MKSNSALMLESNLVNTFLIGSLSKRLWIFF